MLFGAPFAAFWFVGSLRSPKLQGLTMPHGVPPLHSRLQPVLGTGSVVDSLCASETDASTPSAGPLGYEQALASHGPPPPVGKNGSHPTTPAKSAMFA